MGRGGQGTLKLWLKLGRWAEWKEWFRGNGCTRIFLAHCQRRLLAAVAFGVALDGNTDYSELVVVKSRKAEEVARWMEGIRAGLWRSVMKELRVE